MDHYQFIFETGEEGKREILIAMLDDIGFTGFEETGDQLKAYIKKDAFSQDLFDNIIKQNNITYLESTINSKNWNEEWESGFEPVLVPDPMSGISFVAVRANFHKAIDGVTHDLVITPKMSFGTGHHATTYLMIQQMCLLDFKDKTVIDFGTGTGVLAIFAEKLGASKVVAIDNDDWSISNAQENILANDCKKISLVKGDTIDRTMKADIILANINLNIIIANLEAIKSASNPGNSILFSGIMTQDEGQLIKVLERHNFSIKSCVTRDNWIAVLASV